MESLVRLRTRPSRDGKTFKYFLDYKDENGKRRQTSLRHADWRKAKKQRDQKERELRAGSLKPESMRLSVFLDDSLRRTRGQVRDSSLREASNAMKDFVRYVGDIDYQAVMYDDGELFVRACLDSGNAPATVAKKVRHLKRLFQLAVDRRQLEENPLSRVKQPKSPARKVHIFIDEECRRLIKVGPQFQEERELAQRGNRKAVLIEWELLIRTALCTGMRRGELLNTIWRDIDFDAATVEVAPKFDSEHTWEWHVKDADRRTLPLTEDVLALLAEHQARASEGCPYVFVPMSRYSHIQKLRNDSKWTVEKGRCPVNNFTRQFNAIQEMASVEHGEFHDLRRTCLTNWLSGGLSEFEVAYLAGHAKFETTRRFYLAVRRDLVDRARAVSEQVSKSHFVAHLLRTPENAENERRPASINACQPKT